jgi:magnesium transporter
MDPDPVFATVNQDQEEIARSFRKYDLHVMPVIDEERRLVGRITVDDVMDVFHEEASEDLARFAGAPDIESNELAPLAIVRLRLPWLLITMFTGLVISVIIQRMTGLTSIEGLAAFVPVIMAMGGNTGMQASAVTVRSIALGEIRFDELFSVFGREIRVGIMMGIACGLVTAVVVWFNLNFFHAPMTISTLRLSSIVALSMCMAMTFASFAGTLLPILLHRLKIDPAVASGPFVTTGNDLSASLIYFAMCYFLLRL